MAVHVNNRGTEEKGHSRQREQNMWSDKCLNAMADVWKCIECEVRRAGRRTKERSCSPVLRGGINRTYGCRDSVVHAVIGVGCDGSHVTTGKRQAVERTESGMVTEFLEVPRNCLEGCILGAEWNAATSRVGRTWVFKTIHLEYGTLFCTTSWWIGTRELHA